MKREKKEMIRNLLYSFCIHLLFLLILVFNNDINKLFNKKVINVNSLNINSNFLEKNDINATDVDFFPNLTLDEKIELYKIAKENEYDPKSPEVSNNDKEIKDFIDNKVSKNGTSGGYVLYLGPTDYKKYILKKNEEKIKEQLNKEAEEKLRLDEIISNLSVETIQKMSETVEETKLSENSKNEQKEIKNEQKSAEKNINIDPDKIFTKDDIEKIKEITKNEINNQVALSFREKNNIQNQLIFCYKNALVQTSIPSKVAVSVTIKLFPNGIIDTKKIHVKIIDNENKFTTRDYDNAIKNAKIALAYCNPLRNMPTNKYSSWQNINFVFDVIN